MTKSGLLRAATIIMLALIIPLHTGAGEEIIPPSPEPPAAKLEIRPTPEPTAVPEETVIDHINHPEIYPKLSFPKDAKLLEIWFPNIRDADEAILVYDGQVWMIDCGDKRMGSRGAVMLRQLGISRIDVRKGRAVFYRVDKPGPSFVEQLSAPTPEKRLAALAKRILQINDCGIMKP